MSDVEKVARAIPDEAVEKALLVFYDGKLTVEEMWRINGEDLRPAMRAAIEAALAAMGEREAVGEASVRPQFLATEDGEFNGNTHASPRPEAVEEAVKAGDWRAVDDAIWFFLGHENHNPEESARLRRMSGVVLGLAGEENKG